MLRLKKITTDKDKLQIIIDDQMWGILPKKSLTFSLSEDNLPAIKKILYDYYLEKLLSWIEYQERTVKDAREYLWKYNLHQSITDEIIDYCVSKNYLNDERFAEMFIESYADRGKSKSEIRQRLMQKQVSPEIINRLMPEIYTPEVQNENLDKQIKRALQRFADYPQKIQFIKCSESLVRKGFSYQDFKERLREMIFTNDESTPKR